MREVSVTLNGLTQKYFIEGGVKYKGRAVSYRLIRFVDNGAAALRVTVSADKVEKENPELLNELKDDRFPTRD